MSEPSAEVVKRAERVGLVLLDSDGVLTDGRIVIGSDGNEWRAFDVRDGHGIRMGRDAGLVFGIVSGRRSKVVEARARELGIEEVHQKIQDKGRCVEEILSRSGVSGDAACFVGDDLIDLPAMRRVGLSIAPADAVAEVRHTVDWVTARGGGRGAVREVVELLLRASGRWERATARYFERD